METVSCFFCHEDKTDPLFVSREMYIGHDSFQLVRCRQCHLVYLNPRPTVEELKKYYLVWREDEGEEEKAKSSPEWIRKRESWKCRLLRPYLGRAGSVLDVGAGAGEFLSLMRKHGWETAGVEPSPVTSRYAREGRGIQVFTGTLQDIDLPHASYDLVTLWEVIEHLPDPLAAVKKITLLLKKGGTLVFSTPNIEGLPVRWFGSAWWTNVPRHLYFFSPKTVRILVEESGLELTAIKHHTSLYKRMGFAVTFKRWVLNKTPRLDRKVQTWLGQSREDISFGRSSTVPFTKKALDWILEYGSFPIVLFSVLTHQGPDMIVYATKARRET